MKGQRKQFLILLAVLAALGGCFWGLRQYNRAQSGKPVVEDGETVLSVNQEDIIKISYNYEGRDFTFEKEGEVWYYAPDRSLNIMQHRIDTMLRNISEIKASDLIENPADPAQYGLEEPERKIIFETADAQYVICVGDYNSMTGVYYISTSSDTIIYAVPDMTVNAFNYTVEDLTEEPESTEAGLESLGK